MNSFNIWGFTKKFRWAGGKGVTKNQYIGGGLPKNAGDLDSLQIY